MEKIENSFRLSPVIVERTKGAKTVCEIGAGIFRMFHLYPAGATKVGIELMQSYIDKRVNRQDGIVAIQGNAMDFEKLLDEAGYTESFDVILLIDFIEHLDKQDSIDLIERTKSRAKKVFVFTPLDEHPQDGEDSYGFAFADIKRHVDSRGEAKAAIEAQRHKSTWHLSDFEDMKFDVVQVNRNFHPGQHKGAIWGEWHK